MGLNLELLRTWRTEIAGDLEHWRLQYLNAYKAFADAKTTHDDLLADREHLGALLESLRQSGPVSRAFERRLFSRLEKLKFSASAIQRARSDHDIAYATISDLVLGLRHIDGALAAAAEANPEPALVAADAQ